MRQRSKPISEKDRSKVMKLFLNNIDNRISVIVDKTGISTSKVDKIITQHYKNFTPED